MKKLMMIQLGIAFSMLVMGGAWAQTESNEQDKGRPPRHGPPPAEALSICEGQSDGAACKFVTPHGDEVSGICENTPQGDFFACKPDRPPHRRDGRRQMDPPPTEDLQ